MPGGLKLGIDDLDSILPNVLHPNIAPHFAPPYTPSPMRPITSGLLDTSGAPDLGGGNPAPQGLNAAPPMNIAKPTRQESNAAGKAEFRAGRPVVDNSPENQGTSDYFRQNLAREDYDKQHHWGSPISEHPGFWGKVGHGLGVAANIAGDILDPSATSLIPGSDLNKNLQRQANMRGLGRAQDREETAQNDESKRGLEDAQTKALEDKPGEEWSVVSGVQGPNGEAVQQEKGTGRMRVAPVGEVKPEKEPKQSFEEQSYSEWAAQQKAAGKPSDRVSYQEQLKAAERTPRQPTDREEWMADHKGQTNPETGKPYDMEDYWKAKAGAPAAAKAGAAEESGRAAQQYADDYLKGGHFTGAGDEALMEKYFELAKPSSGFRMTQSQIEMLTKAQDLMNSIVAKGKHLFSPEAPYFSKDLREQIVQTMKDLQTSRDEVKGGKKSPTPGGGSAPPRPQGVPENATWDETTRHWKVG